MLALLLLAATPISAFSGTDEKPRPLQITASTSSGVPLITAWGFPLNDNHGDFFFQLDSMTIMKISHSSFETMLYKLPADVHDSHEFFKFAVTPSGEPWILASAGPELLAVHFDSKGEVAGKATLPMAFDRLRIDDFAVLDNDALFLSGVTTEKNPYKAGRSFIGLFDGRNGREIRILRDSVSPDKTSLKQRQEVPHDGAVCAADDGNIYLLHESEIIGINPAGEILRRVSFEKPMRDLIGAQLKVSAGLAAIWLITPPKEGHFQTTYLVVSLDDQNTLGWYAAPPGMQLPAMRFSRNHGFEFLQPSKGVYQLITAEMR